MGKGGSNFFVVTFLRARDFLFVEVWMREQTTLPVSEGANEEQPVVQGDAYLVLNI